MSRLRWTAVALVVVLPGCSGGGSDDAASSTAPTSAASANPVIDQDFPDPDVLEVDGTYYAYATNGQNRNVQVASSTDLATWEVLGDDALPDLPPWVVARGNPAAEFKRRDLQQ